MWLAAILIVGWAGKSAAFSVNTFAGHTAPITSTLQVPDSSLMFTASEDMRIIQWDTTTMTIITSITAHTAAVNSLAFYDGALFSCGADGKIKRWAFSRGSITILGTSTRTNTNFLSVAAGYGLIFASTTGALHTYNISTKQFVSTSTTYSSPKVYSDGVDVFASCGNDRAAVILNPESTRSTIGPHPTADDSAPGTVIFSNRTHVVTAWTDYSLYFRDLTTRRFTKTLALNAPLTDIYLCAGSLVMNSYQDGSGIGSLTWMNTRTWTVQETEPGNYRGLSVRGSTMYTGSFTSNDLYRMSSTMPPCDPGQPASSLTSTIAVSGTPPVLSSSSSSSVPLEATSSMSTAQAITTSTLSMSATSLSLIIDTSMASSSSFTSVTMTSTASFRSSLSLATTSTVETSATSIHSMTSSVTRAMTTVFSDLGAPADDDAESSNSTVIIASSAAAATALLFISIGSGWYAWHRRRRLVTRRPSKMSTQYTFDERTSPRILDTSTLQSFIGNTLFKGIEITPDKTTSTMTVTGMNFQPTEMTRTGYTQTTQKFSLDTAQTQPILISQQTDLTVEHAPWSA